MNCVSFTLCVCIFVYREKNNINFCVFTLSKLYPNTYYICKVVFKKDNMPQDTVTKNLKSDSLERSKVRVKLAR